MSSILLGCCGASCTGRTSNDAVPVSLGAVSEFAVGITELPMLRIRVYHENHPGVRHLSALSLVCPHQGCSVRPQQEGFVCPCHGARFSPSGGLIQGPAQRGLKWIKLELNSSAELLAHLREEVASEWNLEVDPSFF